MENQMQCKAYIAEFFGTFLLVFLGCGAAIFSGAQIGTLGVSLAFGMALASLVYIFGPISGCHLNPAVTLVLGITKKFPCHKVVPYIVMQILGGIVAAYVLYWIASGKAGFNITQGFATNGMGSSSPQGYSLTAGILIEVIATAILLIAVLSTTLDEFPKYVGGFFLGSVLSGLHFLAIPITNSSLNIARSIGPAIITTGEPLSQLWLFAVAHVGAILIAIVIFKGFISCCCKGIGSCQMPGAKGENCNEK